MRNENTVKIKIIRHGKTPLNEKKCYVGVTDESLSELGKEEIEKAKSELLYEKTDTVFSSPMKRAIETAELIFNDARIIVIDELKEMNFGSFEGKNYDQLKDNLYYRKWIDESRGLSEKEIASLYKELEYSTNTEIKMPEDRKLFQRRVIEGIKKTIIQSESNDITIVAHGGTVMAVSSLCEDSDYYKYMVKNTEGIEVLVTYKDSNGDIEISRVSFSNRICS